MALELHGVEGLGARGEFDQELLTLGIGPPLDGRQAAQADVVPPEEVLDVEEGGLLGGVHEGDILAAVGEDRPSRLGALIVRSE